MIKQAIIPLAGLGTRLLPLTSVLPKELLPINGKPGLEYILDECIEAGIKEIIFIISTKKQIIKKYFYNDAFFRKIIKKAFRNRSKLVTSLTLARNVDYFCWRRSRLGRNINFRPRFRILDFFLQNQFTLLFFVLNLPLHRGNGLFMP